MGSVLSEIIDIMVSAIGDLGSGIASGATETLSALFLDTTGSTTKLSVFGGVVAIFAGIALATGVTRLVWNMVTKFKA